MTQLQKTWAPAHFLVAANARGNAPGMRDVFMDTYYYAQFGALFLWLFCCGRLREHVPLYIGKSTTHLLAGIKDTEWVKYFFCFLKKAHHFGPKKLRQIRRANNAVVMLAGGG